MRSLAVVLLCLVWIGMCVGGALARPAASSAITPFDGDRYGGQTSATAPARSLARGLRREVRRAAGGRPRAWCGWWLGQHLGMTARSLWLAANWAKVGAHASGPAPGVIVVWRHHVGIITGQRGGDWVVKSGNDGHAVRERPRSLAGAIAFRRV